jgi:hypothetical protein
MWYLINAILWSLIERPLALFLACAAAVEEKDLEPFCSREVWRRMGDVETVEVVVEVVRERERKDWRSGVRRRDTGVWDAIVATEG